MNKLIVTLEHDSDLECPADMDGQWRPYSFGRRHNSYKDSEELGLSLEQDEDGLPIVRDAKLKRKLKAGLAFFLSYYEHGQSLWFRHGQAPPGVEFRWDGVRVAGLLVWEHPANEMGAKDYADRARDADAFLRVYTAWANGEGYCFDIKDEAGEYVDGCGGFFSPDGMLKDYVLPRLKGREYEVNGGAAYLLKEK